MILISKEEQILLNKNICQCFLCEAKFFNQIRSKRKCDKVSWSKYRERVSVCLCVCSGGKTSFVSQTKKCLRYLSLFNTGKKYMWWNRKMSKISINTSVKFVSKNRYSVSWWKVLAEATLRFIPKLILL